MGRAYQDFTGQKIGFLAIVERISVPDGRRSGIVYWRAVCDCGQEKIITSWAIRDSQGPLSCGCKKYINGQPKNRKYTNPKDVTWNVLISSYRSRCQRDDIVWSLTRTQAITLFQDHCHYCGIRPFITKNGYHTKKWNERNSSKEQNWKNDATVQYNGIDRVDSSKDYTINNTVTCCKICNYAKRDLDPKLFTEWLHRITNHIKDQ